MQIGDDREAYKATVGTQWKRPQNRGQSGAGGVIGAS